MKYDCYKQGISGAFEVDLNDPIETAKVESIDDAIAQSRARAQCARNNQKLNNTLEDASPDFSQNCAKLAEEHDQLADWLEELKAYRANEGMSENVYKAGYKFGYGRGGEKMRKPTIKDRIWGVLMYILEYIRAVIRNDKGSMELLKIIIKLTAEGDFEIDEDIHKR